MMANLNIFKTYLKNHVLCVNRQIFLLEKIKNIRSWALLLIISFKLLPLKSNTGLLMKIIQEKST